MTKSKLTHGFELKDKQFIDEIKADAFTYEHVKSGARLIHLACEDHNKVFCVTFRTPPGDNTGCPHILEHSVLNGSRNFPSKSPFMELLKGSMQTFLNAMTGSDRTMYPVASTNDKDFMNLMEVYLDAVFFPLFYQDPRILAQEGWHYELLNPEDEISYKGVVYNEMKGAFSSPDAALGRYIQQAQFPDNAYGYESGGDPKYITDLTQEMFCAFYDKYYHPANSRIVLSGDMDIDAALKLMNEKYLSEFDKQDIDSSIHMHKPFEQPRKIEVSYPVDEGSATQDMCYLAMNYTFADVHQVETVMGMSVLTEILMDSPASPLKQAILNSGLCADSYAYTDSRALQPTLSIICKNVADDNLEPLQALIRQELEKIVSSGIDKKLIEAILNSKEFTLREAQMQGFPKGLYYAFVIGNSWLYDGEPFEALRYEPLLAKLRQGLKSNYYEDLLKRCILENTYSSIVVMKPEPGLNARLEREDAEKLAAYKASLSEAEIADLIQMNKDLIAWQNEPDKPEDIAKIPFIELSDIDPKAEVIPCEIEEWKEFTLLKHELDTNGIVYYRAYFDLDHAEVEDLPWIALYTYLAGKLDTASYSYSDLSNEIDINTGGIKLWLSNINDYQDPDHVIGKLNISGKAVRSKAEKMIQLAAEYALRPLFDNHQRIKQLIREQRSRMEMSFMGAGHGLAVQRLFSPFSPQHRRLDVSEGLGYYHFLCDLENSFENGMEQIVEELQWVKETFFTQQKLIISLTGEKDDIDHAFGFLSPVLSEISNEAYAPIEQSFDTSDFNEGIYAPLNVQFCAKGGNFFRKGYSYSGKMRVLNNILKNDYLYNEIRVKGGAYGNISNFSLSGFQFFVSYRDPNLEKTLDVYDSVADYLRTYTCSRRELEKYIIGDMAILDYPNTPERKGTISDEYYMTGFTHADKQQIRDEVLSTKLEDIVAYADMIEALMTKNHYCVVGNEAKIKASAQLFDRITPIFR